MKKPVRNVVLALLGLGLLLAGRGLADDGQDAAAKASAVSQWPENPAHQKVVADADKSVAEGAKLVADDRLRPAYHFLCASRFMNDPNGCVQFNGDYHMFFQHIPYMDVPNAPTRIGWGHAVSHDLVHWKHLPIALMPGPGVAEPEVVASGGCVIADGEPTIVYTAGLPSGQAQSLARSFDGMQTWRRFAGNPVLAKRPEIPNLEDGFRDPFVWCEGKQWKMVVGSGIRGQGGTVLLYESPDLVKWNFVGPLCIGMGADCFQWECPNFFKVGDQWVLVVSPLLHSIPSLRGPVQYAVGRYDGRRFEPGPWHIMDFGGPGGYYAPNSLEDDKGRRILWGWLMGGGGPGMPWNGLLTVPRHIELGPDASLRVSPVREIDSLRKESIADLDSRELKAGQSLEVCRGTQFDAVLELKRGSGKLKMELFRSAAGDQATIIEYDLANGRLCCGDKVGNVPFNGDAFTLRILVDRSVIEIYADGRETLSLRAHPPVGADGFRLTAEGAPVQLSRLRAWRMDSIWTPADSASLKVDTQPGWTIWQPTGEEHYRYRYGPTIIINPDKSIDMWASSNPADKGGWDAIRHRRSTDGGRTWGDESVAFQPTPGSNDALSTCDPGVIKIGEYYYIGYTSTINATSNDVYVARSKSASGGFEKWNGAGWGGSVPQPFIRFTGSVKEFGAGEPSFVVKDGTIYVYYTWYDTGIRETRVATAPADDPNWPARLVQRGTALRRAPDEDSTDVKYVDAYRKFIAVGIGRRMGANSYVHVWESQDGIQFTPCGEVRQHLNNWAHNIGISGTPDGHFNIDDANFIAYAYSENDTVSWGWWHTYLNPITIR